MVTLVGSCRLGYDHGLRGFRSRCGWLRRDSAFIQRLSEEIRVVDVVTQAVRATINGISGYQLASTDFDGDGQTEIATVGMRGEYPNHNVGFFVVDGLTGLPNMRVLNSHPVSIWLAPSCKTPAMWIWFFGSTYAENRAGFLTRVNASTGEVRWRTAVGQPLNLAFLKDLKVANLEGEINPTLLALGSNVTEKLVALDSTSGSVLGIDSNDIGFIRHMV